MNDPAEVYQRFPSRERKLAWMRDMYRFGYDAGIAGWNEGDLCRGFPRDPDGSAAMREGFGAGRAYRFAGDEASQAWTPAWEWGLPS